MTEPSPIDLHQPPPEEPVELRHMPHCEPSEKFVLSRFITCADLRHEHPLDPDIFYLAAHRVIYRRLLAMPDPDLESLVMALHDHGELDRAGGPGALSGIYTYAVGDAFPKRLTRLRKMHARRKQIEVCNTGAAAAYDMDNGDGFLDAIAGPVTEVFDIAADAKPPRDTKALAREFMEIFERRVTGTELTMGLSTGIPEIDQPLRGLHPQMMGVISARSGGGKSTLATQITANLATSGTGVLYLILERTEQSAWERCVIQTAGLHHMAVTDPKGYARSQDYENPDHFTLTSIRQAITKLTEANLHIRKPENRHLATQCAEIRRYHRLYGIKVVVLDQIGLVRGVRQKGDTEVTEIKGISNTLQELAHELGITLIALSQVNADGDTKGAKAIEEDADWWLSIIQERDKTKQNFGEHQHILIAKDSHNSKTGMRLPLILDHGTLRFVHGYPQKSETKKTRYEQ